GVVDTTPPVVSGCPTAGVPVTAPAGATSAVASWVEPTAVDNSGGTVTVTSSRSPGQSFPLGTTQVTYTFTDPSQNTATCTFAVTVTVFTGQDTEPPVINGC
ncbi:hyalin-like, partial [Acanthaster planci]|uniref:Hyalin-like n=1 Tax=Acanthaster planci TaxID=133434 RepID=A0A8B8A2Z8_ACAPL